jgi:hypothetical protein
MQIVWANLDSGAAAIRNLNGKQRDAGGGFPVRLLG